MKLSSYLSHFKDALHTSIYYSPISFLFVVITACSFIILNAIDAMTDGAETFFLKIATTGIVSFFFSVGVQKFVDTHEKQHTNIAWLQTITILYALVFYIFLWVTPFETIETVVYIILMTMMSVSLIYISPFFWEPNAKNNEAYFSYFYEQSKHLILSGIVWLASLLLGFIAIGSTFALFDLSWTYESDIYAYWMIFSLVLYMPIYFLYQCGEKAPRSSSLHVFISFLVRYIGVPSVYIYFIILYSYTAKVLMNFSEWPHGEVSWMVIGFSILGYLLYILSAPLHTANAAITWFRRVFPYAVLFQAPMLFYAIYLRIAQYDLTINRYFVMVFGLWLVLISLYYIFSHKKYLKIIPLFFFIFTVLTSVGPWGVFELPESRQYDRLVHNLETAHILQGSEIVPLSSYTDIDAELSWEIYAGIQYLCDFSNCDRIESLFESQMKTIGTPDSPAWDLYYYRYNHTPSTWQIVEHITKTIKVQANYGRYENEYSYYHVDYSQSFFPIDTTDSLALTQIHTSIFPKVQIDMATNTLSVELNAGEKESTDITGSIEKFQTYVSENRGGQLETKDMYFTAQTESYEVEVFLESIEIPNIWTTWKWSVSGYALIRKQ